MSLRNKKSGNRTVDDDFYSALAADAGGEQDSDVSDADVAALTKALEDMDDMDDALFASSLKNRKSSTLKSEKKDDSPGKNLTRTLSPPSLMNTADSKRRTFTIKEESSPDSEQKAGTKSPSILKKTPTKSLDFGEFDEDDPLAGLLSDEDDAAKSSKQTLQQKILPKDNIKGEQGNLNSHSPSETPQTVKKLTSPRRRSSSKNEDEGNSPDMRAKSAPPLKRSDTPKRSDDVDFGDDNILDTMGFDDTSSPAKMVTGGKAEEEEVRAAQSKVADLFGKKSVVSPPEKPPVGRSKEFVLDAKYRKHEKAKPQKELNEEDFSFGSYTPSAVVTLKRSDSAPPGRRSVRFADDVDDLFGGSSTLDRPVRGAGQPGSTTEAVSSSSEVKGQNDDDSDWLSMAIGRKKGQKTEENQTIKLASQDENREKREEYVERGKMVPTNDRTELLNEEKMKDEERTVSPGDYLGLGDDIDLDTLLSSKPASQMGNSRRRDLRSSFPWEDPDMVATGGGLGSTVDSNVFGDTMSSEAEGQETSLSSSLITRQVAELDRLEKDEQAKKLDAVSDQSIPKPQTVLNDPTPQREGHRVDSQRSSPLHQPPDGSQSYMGQQASVGPESYIQPPSAMRQQPTMAEQQTVEPQSSVVPHASLRPKEQSASVQQQASLDHHQGIDGIQSEDLIKEMDTHGTAVSMATTKRSQSATPGPKKEPHWRQELRMRQEQMKAGHSSSPQGHPPHAQDSLHHPQSHVIAQSRVEGNTHAQVNHVSPGPASVQGSVILPLGEGFIQATPSLPQGGASVQASLNHWQDQVKQQKQQAVDFEQALREQQNNLKAQQEEQMRYMQQMQQESMQQQLQMQQQMMQAQTMGPPPSMMSYTSQPFTNSFRNPAYDNKVQQLEDEKRYLETSLKSLQDQHKQQLTAQESAHQDYVHLVEDSFKKKEERLLWEQAEQQRRFEERTEESTSERTKMMTECHQRIQELQTNHQQQRDIISNGHKQELESIGQKHQRDLEHVRKTVHDEMKAMQESTGHSRSLQAVVDQVGVVGEELGSLQTRISGEHQQQLDRQRNELHEKDQQLRVLQKSLADQQGEMTAERSRLESMIQRLETQIRQQNTQLDEERWRLRQEQIKLSGLQKAVEEERRIANEQTASHQVALQQARDAFTSEQQASMAQLMEERKSLATERALIVRERKDTEVTVKHHMEKLLRENAEREGRLQALMEDEKRVSLETEYLERQKQDQFKEKQLLEKEKAELMREQDKLHEVAEKLRLRAQQIDEAVQDVVKVKQEGLAALEKSMKIKSKQTYREKGIQEQLEMLRALERQIAQERLKQAEEERHADQLISEGLCPNCRRVPTVLRGTGEAFMLPITARPARPINRIQHTHPSNQHGIVQLSSKEESVDHLLNKAEFDHTVSVWRLAADKDKDFLDEETSFLNSLGGQSSSSSEP